MGRKKCIRSKYITATIHQAGFHIAFVYMHAWGEDNNKEEGNRKNVEVYYGTEKLRLQYKTKRNRTFNSSLALH